MIEYSFGERNCKLDWNDFLCVTKNVPNNNILKIYKSSFKNFAEFFEYVDKFKKEISHLLFDGYEYFLENGVLHNLYGPAIIIFLEKSDYIAAGTKSCSFYINGRLVCDKLDDRGCRKTEDFEKNEIFFYTKLTDNITGRDPITGVMYRIKEGVDYIKTPIDLKNRRFLDQRKKKLKQLDGIY